MGNALRTTHVNIVGTGRDKVCGQWGNIEMCTEGGRQDHLLVSTHHSFIGSLFAFFIVGFIASIDFLCDGCLFSFAISGDSASSVFSFFGLILVSEPRKSKIWNLVKILNWI